jgi:hypothetical protein
MYKAMYIALYATLYAPMHMVCARAAVAVLASGRHLFSITMHLLKLD